MTLSDPGTDRPSSVAFHFDVMCPFAFEASLWIREVRQHSGLRVDWRFFSLEEVNWVEGKKHPWERAWSYGWSMMRVGALLRRRDMALLDAWYLAAGSALHRQGRKPHRPEVARQLLADMGLDPGLVDEAMADPSTADEVHDEHSSLVQRGGFGVPTLVFPDGQCLFGPVLVDPPTGDAALRLWEGVCAWREFPHLYEIQRPKTTGDLAHLASAFQPYLTGRDWVSIDRGRVVDFGAPTRPNAPDDGAPDDGAPDDGAPGDGA